MPTFTTASFASLLPVRIQTGEKVQADVSHMTAKWAFATERVVRSG